MNSFPRVGVIGAGPSTLLSLAPATALGIELIALAKSEDDSAAKIARHVVGDYLNIDVVRGLAMKCDLVTIEDASIPLSLVRTLELEDIKFLPSSQTIQCLRDKTLLQEKLGIFFWQDDLEPFDFEIAVLVARSPHEQAATWAPSLIVRRDGVCIETVTPVPGLSAEHSEHAQNLALQIAEAIKLVGVLSVQIYVKDKHLFVNRLRLEPHESGQWTIEGSVTSQYEQHLRAILDLPLGDTSMRSKWAITGNIFSGNKSDMYRPYLHLMARTPTLKFHQYFVEAKPEPKVGHISINGVVLNELRSEIEHALAYLSGEIDE